MKIGNCSMSTTKKQRDLQPLLIIPAPTEMVGKKLINTIYNWRVGMAEESELPEASFVQKMGKSTEHWFSSQFTSTGAIFSDRRERN